MKAADLDFGRRGCGYGGDGRVNRPVRGVAEFAGLSELADVEVFGHSASLKLPSANFENYVLGRRGSAIPARLRVPVPLAGRWTETGPTRADVRPRGEPNPSPGRPVSATVREVSRPELAHSWCARLANVTPASVRKRQRSARRGAGWARSRCNWCGRAEDRAVL